MVSPASTTFYSVRFLMTTVSAIFYGPIMTKGNGLLGIQSVDEPEQVSHLSAGGNMQR